MMTLTLPQTNGSKAATTVSPWLQSSVQSFFSTINWEDSPPEVQQIKQNAMPSTGATATPISMAMSVNQFFAAINWDNAAIAAPVQQATSLSQPKPSEITLDDFSDLF
jgi:hypothetical protein